VQLLSKTPREFQQFIIGKRQEEQPVEPAVPQIAFSVKTQESSTNLPTSSTQPLVQSPEQKSETENNPTEQDNELPEPKQENKKKERKIVRGKGKPIQFGKGKINGVQFYQTIINLKDPDTFVMIGLPNNAKTANSQAASYGDEKFDSFIKKFPGAVVVNGTFFSKDKEERVMGNMVSMGRFLKYSQWESYGTTLGLKAGNEPEMLTARTEGTPSWDEHWFSLTCGPRLVKHGEVWLAPEIEGFTDDHVLGIGPRAAIGFPKSRDKLFIITFLNGLSLEQEAKLMKEIGCYEAMNLDGGASKALARDGKVLITPGRALTNVIVVYDTKHPAPDAVVNSWADFQESGRAEGI
jgi:exopolysaccharide biosynthesis protein